MADWFESNAPKSGGDWFASNAPQEERSVSGFLGNVVKSTGNLVGSAVNAVTHPVQTLGAIGSIPVGAYEMMGGPTPGSWGQPGQRQDEQQLGGMIDFYKKRYGTLEGFANALYHDPAGVAADIATVVGGVGGAAKLGGMARTAGALDTVASAVDPIANTVRAVKGASAVAGKIPGVNAAMETGARNLYQGALKPPPGSSKMKPADVRRMVDTGLKEGVRVSEGGLDDLYQRVDEINKQIKAAIKPGVDIDPQAVAARLQGTRNKFSQQVNPQADLSAIDQVEQNFLNGPGAGPIPADKAQAMKIGTYQQLRGKYGQLAAAQVEAEKALARGVKEELASAFPEISALNARDSELLQLQTAMERAVKRIGNHDAIPIGDSKVAIIKKIVDNPAVKSELAKALYKASQGKTNVASVSNSTRLASTLSRVQAYIDSLSQPEANGQFAPQPAQ